jgi:cell division protein FtsQ
MCRKSEIWDISGKCDGKTAADLYGNVSACLGSQVSGEQIAQIKPILKKLGDKEGILHLETYSENNTTITFEMKEISQEN